MKKTLIRTKRAAIFLLFLFLLPVHSLSAQDEPSDSEIRDRLDTIQHVLKQGESNADRWWTGWLIGYGAATLVQGGIGLASEDKGTRQDMFLGAATTGLGVAGQLLTPMSSRNAPNQLSRFPETTPEERKLKLSQAEKLLRQSASDERTGRSWKAHAITGAVNLASGLVVWRGFHRSLGEGLVNFAINTVVTEVQIWTQPTRAIKDDEAYQERYESGGGLSWRRPERTWFVSVYPGGVRLGLAF